MKNLMRSLFCSVAISGITVPVALAAAPVSSTTVRKLQREIQQLRRETYLLEKEVHALTRVQRRSTKHARKRKRTPVLHPPMGPNGHPLPPHHEPILHSPPPVVSELHSGEPHHEEMANHLQHPFNKKFIRPYKFPVTVTTSAFMGLKNAFSGSDLLVRDPSINEDLVLLKQRQSIDNKLLEEEAHKFTPLLELSGKIEGQLYNLGGYPTVRTDNGINVSGAELDLNALVGEWANAFLSTDYDNSPVSSGNRKPNGRLFVKRAFVVVGNLNVTDFYFSLGEMYVPFGLYASGMVSTPLTESLARIQTATVLLGWTHDGFNAQFFGYDGFQNTGGNPYIFRQFGANIGYKKAFPNQNIDVGVGAVSNIADSQGMQNNGLPIPAGAPAFSGFANPTTFDVDQHPVIGNDFVHRVPGIDVHAEYTMGPVTLMAEYIGAISDFRMEDMTFNGYGARPAAVHAEIDFAWHWGLCPFGAGFAYGHTWDSLALNLPENSYSVFMNASFVRDTVASLEFRHDLDYARGDTATGAGVPVNRMPTGGSRNSIIGQFGVYF